MWKFRKSFLKFHLLKKNSYKISWKHWHKEKMLKIKDKLLYNLDQMDCRLSKMWQKMLERKELSTIFRFKEIRKPPEKQNKSHKLLINLNPKQKLTSNSKIKQKGTKKNILKENKFTIKIANINREKLIKISILQKCKQNGQGKRAESNHNLKEEQNQREWWLRKLEFQTKHRKNNKLFIQIQ